MRCISRGHDPDILGQARPRPNLCQHARHLDLWENSHIILLVAPVALRLRRIYVAVPVEAGIAGVGVQVANLGSPHLARGGERRGPRSATSSGVGGSSTMIALGHSPSRRPAGSYQDPVEGVCPATPRLLLLAHCPNSTGDFIEYWRAHQKAHAYVFRIHKGIDELAEGMRNAASASVDDCLTHRLARHAQTHRLQQYGHRGADGTQRVGRPLLLRLGYRDDGRLPHHITEEVSEGQITSYGGSVAKAKARRAACVPVGRSRRGLGNCRTAARPVRTTGSAGRPRSVGRRSHLEGERGGRASEKRAAMLTRDRHVTVARRQDVPFSTTSFRMSSKGLCSVSNRDSVK